MNRRAFLAAALVTLGVLSTPATAQTPPRIAYIAPSDSANAANRMAAFRDGMRDNGLVEGKHYVIDARFAEGDYARFPAMTRELLQLNPAVIVVSTTASVRAAQQATSTVPIVFASLNDPVESGVVASLARPGGNTTGQSTQAGDTMAKYMQFVRETLPQAKRVAVLINPGNASNPNMFEQVRTAAGGLGMNVRAFEATTPATLDAAFAAIALHRPDALLVVRDAMLTGVHARTSAFGLKNRIAVFGSTTDYVDSGSLFAYSSSPGDMFRRSATYVAKILAGAKPADLPIAQPSVFELVINIKTAKAIGIEIPRAVLLRADRVIE